MGAEERARELGLDISVRGGPMANYVPAVRAGGLVFLAGHGPRRPDGSYVTGRLGADLSLEEGYAAARLAAVALLASLRAEVGSLDRVRRVVKVLGMVNATPEFRDHPRVVNGASDLLTDVFGEAGRHARSAVGMAGLPMGIAVEVEMVVELVPE
jgi:enamine deaminase RidA (YjgF/YER057c/UK114 family)